MGVFALLTWRDLALRLTVERHSPSAEIVASQTCTLCGERLEAGHLALRFRRAGSQPEAGNRDRPQ